MSKSFWRGFLRGLGDPTAITVAVMFVAPVCAYLATDIYDRVFMAVLGALCWLVFIGAVVRRKMGWDQA